VDNLGALQIGYACAVVVLSYAIRGSAGFGAVTIPLLALALPMKIIVPVVTVLGVLSSCSILASDARHVIWRELWQLLPSSLVGAAVGLYFFNVFDAATIAHGLGVVVLCYGSYAFYLSVRPRPNWSLPLALMRPLMGTTAGVAGTLFGSMAGMFYAIYLDMKSLPKDQFRATVAAMLFVLGSVRGAGYYALGAFNREAMIACAIALPLMLIGAVLGNRIHTNLDQPLFRRFIAVLLLISGVPLLMI
jgi:uncharacterized membrane protein YfcA